MKLFMNALAVVLLVAGIAMPNFAQDSRILTEASTPEYEAPLDDIIVSTILEDKRVLAYDNIREADVLWKRRVWQVIDTREKMNQPFSYPERPLFGVLVEAATSGDLRVYSGEDDKFTNPLQEEEILAKISSVDSIIVFDPEDYTERIDVIRNDIDFADVKRYRIKEMWYFDEELSQMKVRILGIAPLLDKTDDAGNFLYELPLFWVYYPHAREILAREQVFNFAGNDASPTSWEDLFEMRFFSSYIYKESNVRNDRLKDYVSGTARLLEADKIKSEIFNFEHDMWSY